MGSSVSKGKSANQKQDFVLQGQGVKKGKEQAAADAHPTKHPATTQHKASKTNATHARSTPSSSGVDKAKGQQHGTAAAEPKAAPQSAAKATKLTPEEQEQISIDLQFAQKFRAFQASADSAQSKGNDVLVPENPAASKQLSDEERRRKRDQQEQLSLDQQAVQQFNAMSKMMAEREKASKDKEEERKRLEEQEQISIDQQMAQQFRDFVKVKEQEKTHGDVKAQSRNQSEKTGTESKEKALKEADDLLDAFAPPKSKKAADAEEDSRVDRSNSQGTEEEEGVPLATEFSPDAGSQEDRDSVSCIVAGKLYLTNFRGVERTDELQRLDIRHIVCVNEQNNEFPDQFNYFNIDTLEDQEDHDATVHFSAVKKFTDESLAKGGAVCFHCAAGISRSTTMMIAYLMASRRMSLFDAFQLTYSKRRVAWPNRSFMQQLIQYEAKLQKEGVLRGKQPSIALEDWDMWTTGDMQMLRKQHLITLESRHDSLKGADSKAYREYSEKLQKAMHNQLA